jgi:hypothetical protein
MIPDNQFSPINISKIYNKLPPANNLLTTEYTLSPGLQTQAGSIIGKSYRIAGV